MKKKITMLLLMSSLVLGLAACGNEAAPDPVDTPVPTTEATTEPEQTQAPTPEPTEEPTEAPTPEPTPELPEDREWIDDLYNKIINLDVDAVVEIFNDPELIERAKPYEYSKFKAWDYETGYKLLTSDNEVVGLVTMYNNIYVFLSSSFNDGFEYIGGGDICIYIEEGKIGYFDGEYDHIEGSEDIYIGSDPDVAWMVWHM